MMGTEIVPETSVHCNTLTWLFTRKASLKVKITAIVFPATFFTTDRAVSTNNQNIITSND
jgi:hypothetical protein